MSLKELKVAEVIAKEHSALLQGKRQVTKAPPPPLPSSFPAMVVPPPLPEMAPPIPPTSCLMSLHSEGLVIARYRDRGPHLFTHTDDSADDSSNEPGAPPRPSFPPVPSKAAVDEENSPSPSELEDSDTDGSINIARFHDEIDRGPITKIGVRDRHGWLRLHSPVSAASASYEGDESTDSDGRQPPRDEVLHNEFSGRFPRAPPDDDDSCGN